MNDWIPVEFSNGKPLCKMPVDKQEILVTCRYTGRVKGRPKLYVAQDICYVYDYGDGYIEYGLDNCNIRNWDDITAWMPLPEPYEAKK